MKNQLLKTIILLMFTTVTTFLGAQEQAMKNHKASYIEMNAATGQTQKLATFLTDAAPLVKQTEPGTMLWFALQAPENKLAIFDIFIDEQARNAHFSGVVAGALNKEAPNLVAGGWDKGVVANVRHSSVLSAKAPVDRYSATTATYIKLTAAPGQGENLAALLSAAGAIVAETEPATLFWVALQIDDTHFAIFDIFAGEAGREAHFAGKVAGLLKQKAAVLVEGGWDEGVVANVNNFAILASK